MTAMSKLIHIPTNNIEILFPQEYRKILCNPVNDKSLEAVKILVEEFLKHYEPYIINKKVFTYKLGDSVRIELYLQPVETTAIIIIQGVVSPNECKFKIIVDEG